MEYGKPRAVLIGKLFGSSDGLLVGQVALAFLLESDSKRNTPTRDASRRSSYTILKKDSYDRERGRGTRPGGGSKPPPINLSGLKTTLLKGCL